VLVDGLLRAQGGDAGAAMAGTRPSPGR